MQTIQTEIRRVPHGKSKFHYQLWVDGRLWNTYKRKGDVEKLIGTFVTPHVRVIG